MSSAIIFRRSAAGLLMALLFVTVSATELTAQQPLQSILEGIHYRDIGPTAQGGRFVDFAVPSQQPYTFYAATASGGLWKSMNNGLTFTSLLDDVDIISIGDVTVAPSDPNIVWVGSGEGNNSRSVYYGDGVYKSTDAGETWQHMGLPESHHIGRIVIHPRDPNIVYVAALGHLYSENEERGLYKTTNGGRTWTKVLNVVEEGRNIGVVDVVMDPRRPNTLYAAAYDKERKPWTFNNAGPGSGIYKTTNGGSSWTHLTNGLPGGMLGRIGLTISPQDPDLIYAIIENSNVEGVSDDVRREELREGRPPSGREIGNEVYRTTDGGRSWRKVNAEVPRGGRGGGGAGGGGGGGAQQRGPAAQRWTAVGGSPPYYYGQIIIDPNSKDRLWNLGVGVTVSEDGGVHWSNAGFRGGDNHALWVDPEDSNHMLLGHDHGMGITFDGGENWYRPDNMPLAQFYAIGYDMEYPYNVYGGTQDNGSMGGPSSNPASRGGIRFEDWFSVGGGDGMYNEVDPTDKRSLYNESQFGPIRRLDQVTGTSRSIRMREQGLRFNWCAPILISPHDSNVIYHGGNKLLRSTFRGETWEAISPDLTTADSVKIRGIGNIQHCTITTIDESPVAPGILWVGTDDGNVQFSRDGGENWTLMNDRIPDNPRYWVSRVIASFHDPGKAYVTYTGFRRDDFRPFVYVTTDYGETWTSIASNLPDEPVNVIREDRKNPNLLFVGTDNSVHVSIDGGGSWHRLRNNMPYVAVHDLKIHPRENDLIVGTHGRSMFIADITPLQELTTEVLARDFHLFEIEPTIQWRRYDPKETSTQNFRGENDPTGVVINYFLKEDVEDATIEVYDGERLIQVIEADTTAGLNTTVWNMRARQRRRTEEERQQAQRRQPQQAFAMRGQAGGDREWVEGTAQPGEYRIVMIVNGRRQTVKAVIMTDHWAPK